MKKIHEKSACCRADVIKYGNRRRQCARCKRTWRLWRRKRGRKPKRISTAFVTAFLNRDIASLASLARKRACSEAYLQTRLHRSRDRFAQTTPWPPVPDGDLIIIADAIVEMIEHRWYTVYLMLVRPVHGDTATILPPRIAPGTETVPGWRVAIGNLPRPVLDRVKAIVCDGHVGLVSEGVWRAWVIQRCHFHLLARIQSRRSRFRIGRNKEEAEEIFRLVRVVLYGMDENTFSTALVRLEEIGWNSTSPEIRKILSGFVTNYRDYRSYLTHPELYLPTTNNTAESLASTVADLKQRMRGFPTLRSFERWVIALLKFKKSVACNGFHQPNKLG